MSDHKHEHLEKNQYIYMGASSLIGVCLYYANIDFFKTCASYTVEGFVNLLKLMATPIIFLSLVSVLLKAKQDSKLNKLFGTTLKYTLLTTFSASILALILYLFIQPSSLALETVALKNSAKSVSVMQHLINIIPSNIFQIFIDNNVMAIVVFSILVGYGASSLKGSEKETFSNFIQAGFSIFMTMAKLILKIMPFLLWAFMMVFLQNMDQGFESKTLMLYILTVLLANFIQAGFILPMFLRAKGIKVFETLKGMIPALITAFFSKSSTATIPTTLHCVKSNLKVDEKVANLTVPLCTTINMNGCAAFILITVLYVSEVQGVTFGTIDYISWIVLAVIAAIGNAGVPMGCFFMSSAYLSSMDVSTHLMGIILPFYLILDMVETAINVWSDSCVATIVNKHSHAKSG